MSEIDHTLEPRTATLCGLRGSILGILEATATGSMMIFEPEDHFEIAMAGATNDIARATWGDETGLFELDVVVSHRETKRHVVALRPIGAPRRVQRRHAGRARIAQPCTVFAIIRADPGLEPRTDQHHQLADADQARRPTAVRHAPSRLDAGPVEPHPEPSETSTIRNQHHPKPEPSETRTI
jgi:hypothetical protein